MLSPSKSHQLLVNVFFTPIPTSFCSRGYVQLAVTSSWCCSFPLSFWVQQSCSWYLLFLMETHWLWNPTKTSKKCVRARPKTKKWARHPLGCSCRRKCAAASQATSLPHRCTFSNYCCHSSLIAQSKYICQHLASTFFFLIRLSDADVSLPDTLSVHWLRLTYPNKFIYYGISQIMLRRHSRCFAISHNGPNMAGGWSVSWCISLLSTPSRLWPGSNPHQASSVWPFASLCVCFYYHFLNI